MKYQLTVEERIGQIVRAETHVYGRLGQAKQAAMTFGGGHVSWQNFVNPMTGEPAEDKLSGRPGRFFFEIDPYE